MAMTPDALPSMATKIAVAPSLRSRSASASSACVAMLSSSKKARVAEHDAAALHHADGALAGGRIEAAHRRKLDLALGRGFDDGLAERMLA